MVLVIQILLSVMVAHSTYVPSTVFQDIHRSYLVIIS